MSTTAEPATSLASIREKLGVGPPRIEDWLSMLIFGTSKIGKTHFCGTAADDDRTFPLLVIDCNRGDATLIPKKNKIDVVQVRSPGKLAKIQNDLYLHNKGWYKTCAIDDVTELNDADMRVIMHEAKAQAKNPDNVNVDVPSPREWGIGRNHLRSIIRAYKDLPMNLILTTYDYTVEKEGQPERIMPSLAPAKLRTEIPGFMDIAGYYSFRDTSAVRKRVLQIQGSARVLAGSRYNELPATIDNPTFPMIWEMVKEIKDREREESNG